MTTERITITFNEDGSFRGASATDFGGLPTPVDTAQLHALNPGINTTLFAAVADRDAQIERLKAGLPEVAESATLVDQLAAYVVQLPVPAGMEDVRDNLASQLQH
ncbi:MAG: hypothetical protein WCL11_22670 [Verrucomicrobiota bacterium]